MGCRQNVTGAGIRRVHGLPWSGKEPGVAAFLISFRLAALAVAPLGGCRGAVGRLPAFPALAADVGHVGAVAADHFPAFLACTARFLRIEFVRRSFLVGGLATLARDLTLLILVHRSET